MKSWHTTFLLGLTLTLGAWILLHERSLPSTTETVSDSRLLTDFSPEAVMAIEGTCPTGDFRLERRGRNWMLMEPVHDLADPEKMSQILEALAALPVLDTIREEERDEALSEQTLGFSPETAIGLRLELDEAEPVDLLAGATGPFTNTTYVRRSDREASPTHLVGFDLRAVFSNPELMLRDRRLIRLEPGEVAAWTMKTADGVLQLERDEYFANRWNLGAPLQTRANDDIAYSILEEIVQLEISEFPEDALEFSMAEPDEDTAVFELLPNGAHESVKIALREEEPASPDAPVTMLAQTSHRPFPFRLGNNLVSRLPASVNQFRYPWLTDVDPRLVAAITIRSPRHPDVELRSDGTQWALLYLGYAVEANTERVDRLLTALRDEPILEYVSDTGAGLADYGLDRPFMEIQVVTSTMDAVEYEQWLEDTETAAAAGEDPNAIERPEGREEVRTYRFGYSDGTLMNVYREGEPFVYGVDPAFLSANVETHPLKWRSLQLLGFSLLSLRSVTVEEAGMQSVDLTYDYVTGMWQGIQGGVDVTSQIDRRRATRKARHLGNLEVTEWLTSLTSAYEALDRPSCVLRIGLERSTGEPGAGREDFEFRLKLAPAVLSDTGVAYYYGQIEGTPDAFLISADSYQRITAPVVKLPSQ